MSSTDDVILSQLQAMSQLFSLYPPSREFCQVSELTFHEENGRRLGRNVYLVKIGPYARIKNVIWDLLLATKAENIQS